LQAHALILAAGEGRRFGGGKLHARYRGRPLLSYVLDVVVVARKRGLLDGGHVVVAAGDDRGVTLARGAGLEPIINNAPELGLSHSVRLGLTALETLQPEAPQAALVFLGDQPLVRPDVVEALVTAWRRGGGPVIRPRYADSPETPGHPALVARAIWTRARGLEGDQGLGAFLGASPSETVTLDVKGDNPDVDTQRDLDALEESSG
jgi:molybdenum cofactor cytidylyltransferase